MSNNHRSMREISNQYLPNKQNFQTKWVDFPNHLHPKEEVAFESEQEEMKEEAIVEHYLPFSHPTPSALDEKMNPEKKEGIFQSFKESSKRGNNRDKWRSFLQEKPTHTRFTPSTVPSILKGMAPSISVKKQVAYEELENRLKREPEELLIFSSEEIPLVTVEEVEIEKKAEKMENRITSSKRMNSSLPSTQMVQETLLKTLPDTQAMEVLAPELQPLPGKQRRAMNRSLSWIMEQEQGKDNLPYSQK